MGSSGLVVRCGIALLLTTDCIGLTRQLCNHDRQRAANSCLSPRASADPKRAFKSGSLVAMTSGRTVCDFGLGLILNQNQKESVYV